MLRSIIEKNVFLIVCFSAVCALLFPVAFVWLKPLIPTLLALVMLGVGFDVKPVELKRIYEHKLFVVVTVVVSFCTMALLGFAVGNLYNLGLLEITGLVLVGACPGGFAANVMSYLSRSNVHLTVALTFLSTLVSPLITPLLVYLFLHKHIEMPFLSMVENLLIVIALPLILGAVLNKIFKPSIRKQISTYFPLVSVGCVALILASIVAADKQKILEFPTALVMAVLTMNIAGYVIGFVFAKCAKRRMDECKAISFEFGMQDTAVGIMLSSVFFGPAATLPSVFYSFIQNMTASILVNLSDQHKIEEAHEETRRVLDELNTRSDEEKRNIARQLHDDINPKLILSKLELQKLIPIINNNIADPSQSTEARKIVTKVTDFVGSVYQDSRNLIKNTRFEIIDSMGLTAAIESMVLDYQKVLDKLNIHFEHNLPKRPNLSSAATINTYRIIQEAMLNVIKHSDANNVFISVQGDQNKHCIEVVIVDDGIGINAKNAHGVGLIDMRERARVLGSVLHIDNQPEGGTKISFCFSIQE